MMRKLFILLMCFAMTGGVAHSQGLSSGPQDLSDENQELSNDTQEPSTETLEDQIFWKQEVNASQAWGLWLKEVYRPYSIELSKAILKIVSSTIDIDPTGKSPEELMEEVSAAYNRSLLSMEMIKPPAELKVYHSKVVELYRHTINSDPDEASENALVRKRLTVEADQAITKTFQLHGVSQKIIDRFTRD